MRTCFSNTAGPICLQDFPFSISFRLDVSLSKSICVTITGELPLDSSTFLYQFEGILVGFENILLWLPMLSLSLHTLDSRLSPCRKILTMTEGYLRARHVDSVEWCFDSFSMRRPISPWNDSSRSSVQSVRIKFSQPNRSTGTTQTS